MTVALTLRLWRHRVYGRALSTGRPASIRRRVHFILQRARARGKRKTTTTTMTMMVAVRLAYFVTLKSALSDNLSDGSFLCKVQASDNIARRNDGLSAEVRQSTFKSSRFVLY